MQILTILLITFIAMCQILTAVIKNKPIPRPPSYLTIITQSHTGQSLRIRKLNYEQYSEFPLYKKENH